MSDDDGGNDAGNDAGISAVNTGSIILYGVSEQLIADFEMLQDVESDYSTGGEYGARAKFYQKSIHKLRQHIVCRNYGNICYELSHLCWAILHSNKAVEQSLLDYYWVQQVNSANLFNAYFKQANMHNSAISNASILLQDGFLQVHIHQHDFSISANRANVLSCLMEWLVGFIPNLLTQLQEYLLGKGHNGISEVASLLQKHIYQYLQQHLPTAKLQQRYRTYESWYNTQQLSVNNDSVFAFWREHKHTEGHTKFASVVFDSLAYLHALDMTATSQQLNYASANTSASEFESHHQSIDEVTLSEQVFHTYEHLEDTSGYYVEELELGKLSHKPKVYNKSQAELAELISSYPNAFPHFCLSWMRAISFGQLQNKLIQAKRQKKAISLDESQLLDLTLEDYESIKQATANMMASGNQALLAIVQLLLKEHTVEAMQVLVKLVYRLPSLRDYQSQLSDLLETHAVLNDANIQQWKLAHPWFAHLMSTCEKALKQINRSGFTPASYLDSDSYLDTVYQILRLDTYLGKQIKHILKNNFHQNEKFSADRSIFLNELRLLYSQDDQ